MGVIKDIREQGEGRRFTIEASATAPKTHIGQSISVSGVCLTCVERNETTFSLDLMPETMRHTFFGRSVIGDTVNLELPMALGDELGGHLVYGHVDGVGEIVKILPESEAIIMTVRMPPPLVRYTAMKGSIAWDGVSLTIMGLDGADVSVSLVQYTLEHTTLGRKKVGDPMHLETDMILKYLGTLYERYAIGQNMESGI
ncbi:MAG: riboflavin synthase, alpha subunit [Candidatus Magasanikbacteria bacterium]|nr:riboflavin synthase, alpha subunit [Candidatus Magasanikbacteria bacterium]